MFNEQESKAIGPTVVQPSNPNRRESRYHAISGRRNIEITDNTKLPNVFPKPDEFEKIQRLGSSQLI